MKDDQWWPSLKFSVFPDHLVPVSDFHDAYNAFCTVHPYRTYLAGIKLPPPAGSKLGKPQTFLG